MKIYVINLKKSLKRKEMIVNSLNKLGLDFEIFEAVDGRALGEQEVAKYFDIDYYKSKPAYYSLGVAGCTLSHLILYKKIVEEKIPQALIIEDDAILGNDIPAMLNELGKELRQDEVIMLYYQSNRPMKISHSASIPSLSNYHLYQVNELNGLGSTVGYIIGNQCAKKLFDGLQPLSTAADNWEVFFKRNLINGVRVIYPFCMTHALEPTTINFAFDQKGSMRKILNLVENYKIFPFYQLLRRRRKKCQEGRRDFQIVDESPVDLRQLMPA